MADCELPVDTVQDDIGDMLEVLGLGRYARPRSCHEVVQGEIIPAVEKLSERVKDLETKLAGAPLSILNEQPDGCCFHKHEGRWLTYQWNDETKEWDDGPGYDTLFDLVLALTKTESKGAEL